MVTDEQIAHKFLHIKSSASSRGLEFGMTLRKVRSLLNTKTCFYTGVRFTKNPKSNSSLTFDRVDSSVGYIDSNVVACTKRINSLKANLTDKEIEQLFNGIQKHKLKTK